MTNKSANKIYSVTQLNSNVRNLIEETFALVFVEAEISNLSQPKSGHVYLTLKDDNAQVRCAMFRNRNCNLGFKPENGMRVLVQAQVSLYEPRGDYQLIIYSMDIAGEGLLRLKFEQLKKRLDGEGLFNTEHKKNIPAYPDHVGIITSPTGAAIRDIISILKRRFAHLEVTIYPSAVQGSGAASEIAHAIQLANKHNKCDILIVTRGGGSLEDLWSFNEEIVAQAIYASKIPIISAVGHEIDFTIADFTADLRAPTPSAAAELVSANAEQLAQHLQNFANKLLDLITGNIKYKKNTLENLGKRLQHPKKKLQTYAQQLDKIDLRLNAIIKTMLKNKKNSLVDLSRHLNNLNPLTTLQRGYAVVSNAANNKILTTSKDIEIDDTIFVRLHQGSLVCSVRKKNS